MNGNNSGKRLHPGIIGMFLIVAGIWFSSCSDKINLITSGHSDYVIRISDKAEPAEKYAARELQKYIFAISNCNLPIINTNIESAKIIQIGFTGAPQSLLQGLTVSEFGSEEFLIRTSDNVLLIAGGKPRGTLYGVLAFLSDHLGCRWYTKEVVKIPQTVDITLSSIDERQKPVFEYREAWYREAYDAEWAVHNRLNPAIVAPPDSMGGGYKIYPFVHTFYQLVLPQKYFKSHPEYFSMINGKRQGHEAQLCLMNSEVVRIAMQTVLHWIEQHPGIQVISVDQNDGDGWCECPDCKRLDDTEGSHSATILNFVNQIADSVAIVHPNVKLQTLAYHYSEIPPKTIVPRPNVMIRLCHYNYCSAHSLEGCERDRVFVERLNAWRKISKQLTIWDYFTDFSHYLVPYPNFETMKHDVRYYADHNCVGLFAQGCNVPKEGGGEFSALRAWVFAQLMWNPYREAQSLIDEFVTNVYGEAAPFIQSYIELLHNKVKPDSVFFSIYADPTDGGYLTPEVVKKATELFLQAEKTASQDPALLKRVELAHLPILYSRLYFYATGGKAFLDSQEMPLVLNKFQRIIKDNNITQIAEGRDLGNISKFIERVQEQQRYLTNWWIIGPFDNPNENGLKTVYPPEEDFDTTATYIGRNDQSIRWQHINNNLSGYIDFTKLFKQSDLGVAYAKGTIESSENTDMKIGIGSNDGVRLWVNGKLVLDHKIARKAEPSQDVLTVSLKKGKNSVLLKIDQLGGGWGFYFTILEGQKIFVHGLH
jgi:hypothetical protein